jgi:hypothetical protein
MPQLYYAGPNRQPLPVVDDRVVAMLEIGTLTPVSLAWEEGMKRNEKELRSSEGGVLTGVVRNKAISGRN